MADGDGSPRQPPQAYDTVSHAGVGATSTNQVSPGTIQEILDTGDQDLIDQAFDQMNVEDMIAYVEQLPSPSALGGVSPAGVGSQASRTPSIVSVRTPTPSPSPTTQRRQLTRRTLAAAIAAAGAGGDGDDDDDGSGGSRRSTPRGRPDRGRGRGRGRRRRVGGPVRPPRLPWTRPDPSTLPSLGVLGVSLERWVKRIYNDVCGCYKIKNNWRKAETFPLSP